MVQLHANLKEWGQIEGVLDINDPSLWQRVGSRKGIPSKIAEEWRKIEGIDYMPLSTIAAEMLEDSDISPQIGETLREVSHIVSVYIDAGISATTNIAAEIWQSLIPDRDPRAVYCTKPEAAEFLANLTTQRLANPRAAKYNEVCAGALARATEENIRFRHYAKSDDKTSIHAERIEKRIQLTDINSQSVSVATANMASLEPSSTFETSGIFAIDSEGGALNFLMEEGVENLMNERGTLIGHMGTSDYGLRIIPGAMDICNNNDPYFRARGGAGNAVSGKAMQRYKREADRRVKGVANVKAGLHTFMRVIEHEMLRGGGVQGKVLPLAAARAQTYTGFRENIEREYNGVVAVSVAAGEGGSFSSDTGIQEMLLVGTKRATAVTGGRRGQREPTGDRSVTCVNLTRSFKTKLEAKMFADAIRREVALGKKRGDITVGSVVGTYCRMDGLGDGKPWSTLGVSGDYTVLSEFAMKGMAWNPSSGETPKFALSMTTLSGVSNHGPTHHLLGHVPTSGEPKPRGAFLMRPRAKARNLVNPSMWGEDYASQLTMTCIPTHYGEPLEDAAEAKRMLETAGRFHISRNFRMSAQTIAIAYTEKDCMGGRAWTTLKPKRDGAAEAITLFLNSVYGILIRVGYGQITDLGRSTIQIEAIDGHPIPDFGADTPEAEAARAIAVENFDRLRALPLKRVSLCVLDENRAEIDRVVARMLGLPWDMGAEATLDSWRRMMRLQPVVNGNNKTTLRTLAAAGITA